MQIHQLKPRIARRRPKLVGRGGKRGTTSGRGTKGQRARSGHRIRPEFRDILKKLPKLRGYQFTAAYRRVASVVNLDQLEKSFGPKEVVTLESLEAKGLINANDRVAGGVKILGRGEIKKALTIKGLSVSASAEKAIIATGGKVEKVVEVKSK